MHMQGFTNLEVNLLTDVVVMRALHDLTEFFGQLPKSPRTIYHRSRIEDRRDGICYGNEGARIKQEFS